MEEEEEEAELEEVEDLLEFYLQRASALQSEAERMLAGARDLEESIGVSLSARRYEVGGVWKRREREKSFEEKREGGAVVWYRYTSQPGKALSSPQG